MAHGVKDEIGDGVGIGSGIGSDGVSIVTRTSVSPSMDTIHDTPQTPPLIADDIIRIIDAPDGPWPISVT